MYKRYGNKLLCFSPPVMLATFIIEFGFAIYVLWRYKMTTVTRLVVAMLIFLGIFQLTEYMICGGLGLGHSSWARLGYVSITLLPALGLHLVAALAKVKFRPLVGFAYLTAAAYVAYFALSGSSVVGDVCTTNYAVFNVQGWGASVYALYYYGWLIVAAGAATYLAGRKQALAPSLKWMVVGYASFIIPTTLANLADPRTIAAIPSIMCGFAVLLALIMVWRVLPLSKAPLSGAPTSKKRKKASTRN